jgi:hypothetical protein
MVPRHGEELMGTLTNILADRSKRPAVVADAARIVEEQVAATSGLRGMGLKAGFKAFQKLRPGIVPLAVDRLLPHFTPVVDPRWEEAVRSGDPDAWFRQHDGRVADALLGVTDSLASRAQNKVMLRIYQGLRSQARDHVVAGVPRIPELIARHVR